MNTAQVRPVTRRERPTYRADIDGLRALAIALVVVYHVWFDRVSGGVDVFLMVSAYFLTLTITRRLERTNSVSALVNFWARRFARLLPAASVTIVAVLVIAWLMFPASEWPSLWRQAWASLFYVQNWELTAVAVDYYSRDGLSPLQHFWSLSIQGQVFLLWPVLILAVMRASRRRGWDPRRALIIVFVCVLGASFIYSVVFTSSAQQSAYFSTLARLWEFAFGSLLALLAPKIRFTAGWAAVVGWIGIVGLISCGAFLDVRGGFPGYLALWPLVSAALVMLAGATASPWGPGALLSGRALRWLGTIAYSLYLVHWVVLVAYLTVTGTTRVDAAAGTLIIAVSIVLAWLMARAVERPMRQVSERGRRAAMTVVAGAVLLTTIPLAAWQVTDDVSAIALEAAAHPGAAVLLSGAVDEWYSGDVPPIPRGSDLEDEWAGIGDRCDGDFAPESANVADSCLALRSGDATAPLIAVVGDSHAGQWSAVVRPIVEERNWNAISLVRGGCSLAADEDEVPGAVDCAAWRVEALDYLLDKQPDVVFMMGSRSKADSPDETALAGIDTYIDALTANGSQIVLIRDNPRFSVDMFQCVERNGVDAEECTRDKDDVLAARNPATSSLRPGVTSLDLSDYLCPDGLCHPVIGRVVVYMDDNHVTETYGLTMAPAAVQELRPLLAQVGNAAESVE